GYAARRPTPAPGLKGAAPVCAAFATRTGGLRMTAIRSLLIAALLAGASPFVAAKDWRLVWSDEFHGSIGPDWVFETGAGGWGNNELEYYRRENATVENDALVITARREDFGGARY